MSIEAVLPPEAVADTLSIKEISELLVKHYDLHEGFYDLLVQFNIGLGAIGPDLSSRSPGAMISLAKVGLIKSNAESLTAVNAAEINPTAKITRVKRAKTAK